MAPATHLLFLDDAKAPNCQKNNGFKGLGNYSEWPKVAGALIQAYSRIAEQRPDIILKPPSQLMPLPRARSVREGRRNALLPWPVRLGVGISFDENDKPHLTFEKEEFSMSEAAAYFEYTLDVAMRAQRG